MWVFLDNTRDMIMNVFVWVMRRTVMLSVKDAKGMFALAGDVEDDDGTSIEGRGWRPFCL